MSDPTVPPTPAAPSDPGSAAAPAVPVQPAVSPQATTPLPTTPPHDATTAQLPVTPQATYPVTPPPAPPIMPADTPALPVSGEGLPQQPAVAKAGRAWVRPALMGMVGTFVALALFSGGIIVGRSFDQTPAVAAKGSGLQSGSDGNSGSLRELLEGLGSTDDENSSSGSDPRSKSLPSLPEGSTTPDGGTGSQNESQGATYQVVGSVAAIDGSNFTLTTGQSEVTVVTSSDSSVSKLSVGDVVMVIGTADANGNLVAAKIINSGVSGPSGGSGSDGTSGSGTSVDGNATSNPTNLT